MLMSGTGSNQCATVLPITLDMVLPSGNHLHADTPMRQVDDHNCCHGCCQSYLPSRSWFRVFCCLVVVVIVVPAVLSVAIPTETPIQACHNPCPLDVSTPDQPKPGYALAVHGGFGAVRGEAMTLDQIALRRQTLSRCTAVGEEVLLRGGSSVAAVVAAMRSMEQSELFDAHRSNATEIGASVMSGQSIRNGGSEKAGGGIAGVITVWSPIECALRVYRNSSQALLTGTEADDFCYSEGLKAVSESPSYYHTDSDLERQERDGASKQQEFYESFGAVARDVRGHLAAASQTRGEFASQGPMLAVGTWANDATCAISVTGNGDRKGDAFFFREVAAAQVSSRMEYGGVGLYEAMNATLRTMDAMWNSVGGMVGLDQNGEIRFAFSAPGMYHAWRHQNGSAGVFV